MEASRAQSGGNGLVFLIAQTQQLVAIYDKRWSDADAQGSAVLTAAVTLAVVLVTASATLPVTTTWLLVVALGCLSISAGFAVWERSGAGLRLAGSSRRDGAEQRSDELGLWDLSHDSQAYHGAVDELQALTGREVDTVPAKRSPEEIVLQLWRDRVEDVRHVARRKERWAAAAGLMLVLAVIAIAVIAISLVVNHAK